MNERELYHGMRKNLPEMSAEELVRSEWLISSKIGGLEATAQRIVALETPAASDIAAQHLFDAQALRKLRRILRVSKAMGGRK